MYSPPVSRKRRLYTRMRNQPGPHRGRPIARGRKKAAATDLPNALFCFCVVARLQGPVSGSKQKALKQRSSGPFKPKHGLVEREAIH